MFRVPYLCCTLTQVTSTSALSAGLSSTTNPQPLCTQDYSLEGQDWTRSFSKNMNHLYRRPVFPVQLKMTQLVKSQHEGTICRMSFWLALGTKGLELLQSKLTKWHLLARIENTKPENQVPEGVSRCWEVENILIAEEMTGANSEHNQVLG